MGRILKSAAVLIGDNDEENLPSSISSTRTSNNISIWRIDPTGQFWDCHAACVGRGAGIADHTILKHVKRWKYKKEGEEEEEDSLTEDSSVEFQATTKEDVKAYLESLSFEDAIILACECFVDVLRLNVNKKKEMKQQYVVNEAIMMNGIQGLVKFRKGS